MATEDVTVAYASLISCDRILKSGIFTADGIRSEFFRPAVTYLLIELNTALQVCAKIERISDTADVQEVPKEGDLTALIAHCRGAACHLSSDRNVIGRSIYSFNAAVGVTAQSPFGEGPGNPYADDIAIYFGPTRLLLNRNLLHAERRAREVVERLWRG